MENQQSIMEWQMSSQRRTEVILNVKKEVFLEKIALLRLRIVKNCIFLKTKKIKVERIPQKESSFCVLKPLILAKKREKPHQI